MEKLPNNLHYSPELEECMVGHYQAVCVDDEYKVEELAQNDKDIKYIVDLGANIGTASMQFQKYFPEALILSCEPDANLLEYVKLNTDNKLIYVPEAIIGDDRKEVTFNVCKWAGNSHVDGNFRWDLFEPMGSKLDHQITVPACTLKDLIDKHEFPRIDLLKVDTEGMEGQILTKFKPYLNLVKHIRGEWHGDVDREIIREALKDTHNIYFNQKLSTHGDMFATLKGYGESVIDKEKYQILKQIGLPDKIVMK